jgi:ATP synthase protein I
MPSDSSQARDTKLSPAASQTKGFVQQFALTMELPIILVSSIVLGGLAGFFLDRWLHTKPIFMIVLGALGFLAGFRDILRRLPGK